MKKVLTYFIRKPSILRTTLNMGFVYFLIALYVSPYIITSGS